MTGESPAAVRHNGKVPTYALNSTPLTETVHRDTDSHDADIDPALVLLRFSILLMFVCVYMWIYLCVHIHTYICICIVCVYR